MHPIRNLFIHSEECNSTERKHVFIFVCHFVIVLLPHCNKLVTINQFNIFFAGNGLLLCRRGECSRCDKQSYITITKDTNKTTYLFYSNWIVRIVLHLHFNTWSCSSKWIYIRYHIHTAIFTFRSNKWSMIIHSTKQSRH